jgi:hypothetical protein
MSDFGYVEICIGNKSSLVWMDIKIRCILQLKAAEFPRHKFSTCSSLLLLFLHVIWIPGILAFPFPVYIDITDGDCRCSLVSDQFFFLNRGIF